MVVFVFHDAATTDIYTYLHTLSLHDALPICRRWRRRAARYGRGQSTWKSPWLLSASRVTPLRDTAINICCPANSTTASRSEEHTSELQSLMRTSYAVFCSTQKKPQTLHHTSNHSQ